MKPYIWQGKPSGSWYVDMSKENPDELIGTEPAGYSTWREAYDAACHAIAPEPA